MSELPLISDFKYLFTQQIPLLDVRAPIEFKKGAFPYTINAPLIDDRERHKIGKRYKDAGQDAAIELGHELVKGKLKEARIQAWKDFAQRHPDGALYCFRGGMRSKISQQWLYESSGIRFPRVQGGYKAMRSFLLDLIEKAPTWLSLVIIGGRTGVGKTQVLNQLEHKIDLEGLAHHRGSAFGRYASPQPSPIDFENRLAIELLKTRQKHLALLAVEDESRTIGSVGIPLDFFNLMKRSPVVWLEASLEERVQNIRHEYVDLAVLDYNEHFGEKGFDHWIEARLSNLERLKKRLGNKTFNKIHAEMTEAIQSQQIDGSTEGHSAWIRSLLREYYDPMYDYQLTHKKDRIEFQGTEEEVLRYLASHYALVT